MALQEQLDEEWRRMQERSPETRVAYEALVRDLARSGLGAEARKAGDTLPDFELPTVEGRLVSAAELLARGPLVVSFFRGGWCPYCTLELAALQQALPEIERLGATLVAITPDTGAAFAAAKRQNGLAYEVLSDVDNGLGLTLGIVFRVPEAIGAQYRRLGVDLGARHGTSDDAWLLPLPATYIVDRAGIIRHAELDPDFKHRMEPAQIIRVLGDLVANQPGTDGAAPKP
ncbi:MAG: peroxiredoxin-like family protein [Stellaceae bacterium]